MRVALPSLQTQNKVCPGDRQESIEARQVYKVLPTASFLLKPDSEPVSEVDVEVGPAPGALITTESSQCEACDTKTSVNGKQMSRAKTRRLSTMAVDMSHTASSSLSNGVNSVSGLVKKVSVSSLASHFYTYHVALM